MLEFRPVKKEDYPIASPAMYKRDFMTTESSFVTLYMWARLYNCEICIEDGDVFIRSTGGEIPSYLVPYADDIPTALLKIYEHEKENGRDFVKFHSVTEKMRRLLEGAFPGEFSYEERRASFDYIYKAESLAYLRGKKLHGKRNHVNKFMKRYEGRYSFSELSESDIGEIKLFQKKWAKNAEEKDGEATLSYESDAIESLLDNFSYFGLIGGILRVDGEICAYCIASKICDSTIDVMVEKADYAYEGAYQMINQCFAALVKDKAEFLNREDDLGLEGLRRAKLSYYPEMLIEKYSVIWKR